MKIFKELKKLGYMHYSATTIEELDDLPLNNAERISEQALVLRWFREKYNLVHEISWSKSKGGVSFDYDIFSLVLPTDDELGDEDDIYIERPMETYDSLAGKTFRDLEFDSYEGAELACLIKLIEICKKYLTI